MFSCVLDCWPIIRRTLAQAIKSRFLGSKMTMGDVVRGCGFENTGLKRVASMLTAWIASQCAGNNKEN
jgi:hypothetical protein